MADYEERQAKLDAESQKKDIPYTTGRFQAIHGTPEEL